MKLASRKVGPRSTTPMSATPPPLDRECATVLEQLPAAVLQPLVTARGGPDLSPYAAPARATDVAGLPATFIDVGSAEIFRDEAIDYGARLAQAGVPVELHVWAGGFHGFYAGFAPGIELAHAAVSAQSSYLRRAVR